MATPRKPRDQVFVSTDLKHCNQCGLDKPRSDFAFRKQSWDGLRPECRLCRNSRQQRDYHKDLTTSRQKGADKRRKLYAANPERGREIARQWRERNPPPKSTRVLLTSEERSERQRASRIRSYEKHRAKVLAAAAIYRANHKEEERANRASHYQKNKDHVARTTKAYREANKSIYNEASARRRTAEVLATPSWADRKKMQVIYAQAEQLTLETGIPHEVDHIYPIQSKFMCGLHVETNLQILQRGPNRSKSNHRWPGMEWCMT